MPQNKYTNCRCPYCGEDITSMHERDRIIHKKECHERHVDANTGVMVVAQYSRFKQSVV